MLTLFNAVVRPVLEYCSQLWSPKGKAQGLIRKIETVQRQFTAKIFGTEELFIVSGSSTYACTHWKEGETDIW